jgi:uncharacterized protein (TIGR03435 family)
MSAGLTLLMRRHGARVRYLLWLAASAKFLVPFALLSALGAWIPWRPAPLHTAHGSLIVIIGQMAAPLSRQGAMPVAPAPGSGGWVLTSLLVLWVLGTLAVAARWIVQWQGIRSMLRDAAGSDVVFVTPVRSSASQHEPVVVGILRPMLVLPQGLLARLTQEQLRAVLAHERCHVAWRDNLAAAMHMLVEALFWFHPLVWWLGGRLVDERERACDEQVLAEGHARGTYAEGILRVCEHYLKARLPCAAGIGGARLKQRIEGIMKHTTIERLSGTRKLAITMVVCATIAAPVAIGALTAPRAHAGPSTQEAGATTFRNVSIQVTPAEQRNSDVHFMFNINSGTWDIRNFPLRNLIAQAYGVPEEQVVGRDWSAEPTYDITATGPAPSGPLNTPNIALQDLLVAHFGLAVKSEQKLLEGFVLMTAAGGPKLTPGGTGSLPGRRVGLRLMPGRVDARGAPVSMLTGFLSTVLKAPVLDQTGLQGPFDYKLTWGTPDPKDLPDAITQALEEQLALHLERRPVMADVITVVSLSPPQTVAAHR